jgi:predicted ribosome quality control (RQC) complex YloA/Tae2 family protein
LQGQYNSPVVVEQDNNIKIIENLESTTLRSQAVKEGGPVLTSPSQHDNQTYREESQFMVQLFQKQQNDENITIQEPIVQIVDDFGYPPEYIQKCL